MMQKEYGCQMRKWRDGRKIQQDGGIVIMMDHIHITHGNILESITIILIKMVIWFTGWKKNKWILVLSF